MDVRNLSFDDATFDVAIDKGCVVYGSLQQFTKDIWAGTMDAMMTAKGDVWNPPGEVVNNCNQEVDEVLRYLPMILPCPT